MEAIAPIIKGEMQPLRDRIAALEAMGPIEGKAGIDGKDGAPGQDGTSGRDGVDGKDGYPGEIGPQGVAGERGADGSNGADGAPGKDAPAPTIEQLASAINAINEFPELVSDAVASWLVLNPPAGGRDGVDGKDGAIGPIGPIGPQGEARDGRDGQPGVPGLPGGKGADGKDGLGIDDYEVVLEDDGRHEVRRWKRGDEVVKEIRLKHSWPLYRDVWQPKGYDKGDIVTCSNESWIATSDNSDKPPSAAWRLMARKGRDGRDGQMRALQDPGPVKLR